MRFEISPFSKSAELLACGGELGQAFNYFDICTQQHPTDIQVTAQCIQSSMNGYYVTQQW